MRQSERTCCVCRSRGAKEDLIRVVAVGGTLVFDRTQSLPGRGAYVHRRIDCVSRMGQGSRWERALRVSSGTFGQVQLTQVVGQLLKELQNTDLASVEPQR